MELANDSDPIHFAVCPMVQLNVKTSPESLPLFDVCCLFSVFCFSFNDGP